MGLELLDEQYKAYEKTDHLSGMRKTIFYKCLCYEKIQNLTELSKNLKLLDDLEKNYH